jgi:hypothetical protein
VAEFRGVNPRFVSLDEAGEFSGMHPSEQAKQRGWGDDWDNTPAGVILRPLPLGTLVEAWDAAADRLVVGTVVRRESRADSSAYTVRLPDVEITVRRELVTVFDRSPEGIERFLDGPRTAEEMARPEIPKTPEEIERWLDA